MELKNIIQLAYKARKDLTKLSLAIDVDNAIERLGYRTQAKELHMNIDVDINYKKKIIYTNGCVGFTNTFYERRFLRAQAIGNILMHNKKNYKDSDPYTFALFFLIPGDKFQEYDELLYDNRHRENYQNQSLRLTTLASLFAVTEDIILQRAKIINLKLLSCSVY